MDEASVAAAIDGSTFVVHVASPAFYGNDPEQMITPAVNGTLAVMKACQASRVQRCVVTSSCGAVSLMAAADRPADRVVNESHWSNPDRPEGMPLYFQSKVLAEKAAWNFHAALPDDQKFELVVICAAKTMGPPLNVAGGAGMSTGWIKSLLEGAMTTIGADHIQSCDVRDVAQAHYLAVKKPEAAGRRYCITIGCPSF